MTALTAVLLAVNGAVVVFFFGLLIWSKARNAGRLTLPEAAVRVLYLMARRAIALAEALDSAVITYREMTREGLVTRSEVDRELRNAARLQRAMGGLR